MEEGKGKDRHLQPKLVARVEGGLLEALRHYVVESRPRTTLTAVVEAALEEYLTKAGYWPPRS